MVQITFNTGGAMKTEEEYQPFGEEWKNELMKMPKIQIIALYRQLALEYQEYKYKVIECEWRYDEECDFYNTSCGSEYALIDGTLEENEHYYCPFCGKKILLLTQEEK